MFVRLALGIFYPFWSIPKYKGDEQKYLFGNSISIKKKKQKRKKKKGEHDRVNTHAENHVLLAIIKGMKGFFR